jgi:hypothetical protein
MIPNSDDLRDLRDISRAVANDTDAQLERELTALRHTTRAELAALKPHLSTDEATFNALVRVVEQATADNIAIAEFVKRVKTLGANVLAVAKHASTLLPA